MADKSLMLQVMHSITKFFNLDLGAQLNNKVFRFVAEQTQFRVPYPVILMVQNAWWQNEVALVLNTTQAKSFYVDATHLKKCWVPSADTAKQNIYLPKMVYLSLILGKFILHAKHMP
jgi:hypothetical protein